MDNKETLKSMLNSLINDKPEEASLDLHNYITNKMKEISGLSQDAPQPQPPAEETVDNE